MFPVILCVGLLVTKCFNIALCLTYWNVEIFLSLQVSVKDKVFEVLLYFITHEDEDVQVKALAGLGKLYMFSFPNALW